MPVTDPLSALDPTIARSKPATSGGIYTATVPGQKAPDNTMGKDAFLKLLVAQMKYQDPMSPQDGTAFVTQTAQFTMVEKLVALSEQNEKLLAGQNNTAASSLVGLEVAWEVTDDAGKTSTKSGPVTGVKLTKDGPLLRVGEQDIPLAKVTAVKPSDPDPQALILAGQNAATAASLIGRTISWETKDAAGAVTTKSGPVSGVKFTPAGPQLRVGAVDVALSSVTAINPAAAVAAATTTDPTN
jgi:flagellar basal-body rod modification protein FlgD